MSTELVDAGEDESDGEEAETLASVASADGGAVPVLGDDNSHSSTTVSETSGLGGGDDGSSSPAGAAGSQDDNFGRVSSSSMPSSLVEHLKKHGAALRAVSCNPGDLIDPPDSARSYSSMLQNETTLYGSSRRSSDHSWVPNEANESTVVAPKTVPEFIGFMTINFLTPTDVCGLEILPEGGTNLTAPGPGGISWISQFKVLYQMAPPAEEGAAATPAAAASSLVEAGGGRQELSNEERAEERAAPSVSYSTVGWTQVDDDKVLLSENFSSFCCTGDTCHTVIQNDSTMESLCCTT